MLYSTTLYILTYVMHNMIAIILQVNYDSE